MPASSKSQQRFMGMVHAVQKGDMSAPSKEVAETAKEISPIAAKEFASTEHTGLPEHVKKAISQMAMGMADEAKHKLPLKKTRQVVHDHLKEDPNYYTKLENCMRNEKKAFQLGFIKAAEEVGATTGRAIDLLKLADEGKKQDSSFIGRYLAANNVMDSVLANRTQILEDIDPSGERQEKDIFVLGNQFKKQREKGYDYLPKTLRRHDRGSVLKNILLHGVLGAGTGAAVGYLKAPRYVEMPSSIAFGAGVGALAGGATGAIHKLFNNYKLNKITPQDIALMREKQKDRGFLSEFVPGRDVWDAATA